MSQFGAKIKCTFSDEVNYFLGLKFENNKDAKRNVTITLSQEAYIKSFLSQLKLQSETINTPKSPCQSGYTIDLILQKQYDLYIKDKMVIRI